MARFGHDEIGMPDITVDKTRLIEILEANRATHEADFNEAVAAFRTKAAARLIEMAAEIRADKLPARIAFDLPIPDQHLDDYDRAIGMLHLAQGDTLTISEATYSKLVDDVWDWAHGFAANTLAYTSKAGPL